MSYKTYKKSIATTIVFFALVFSIVPIHVHASLVNHPPEYGVGVQSTNLSSGLIGYWPLNAFTTTWSANQSVGTTTDVSGGGHSGVLTGLGRATSTATGKIGQGIKFDGVSPTARIAIGGSTYNGLSTFTASAWVNVTGAGTGGGAILTTQGNSVNGWKLGIASSGAINFTVLCATTNLSVTTAVSSAPFGKWNFVLVTWDGTLNTSGVHIYINGIEAAYGTVVNGVGARASDTSLTIGNVSTGSVREIPGRINEVRLYNRILSQNEITELYKYGQTTINKTALGLTNTDLSNGLAAYWPFSGKYMTWSSTGALGTTTDATGVVANNAPLKNMTRGASVTVGKVGQGLKFNGTNNYVQGPVGLIGSGDVTVCAWIKQNAFGAANVVVGNTKFMFFVSSTFNSLGVTNDGSTNIYGSTNSIVNGVWEHVCVARYGTVGPGFVTFYENGKPDSSTGIAGTPSTSTFNNNVGAKGNGIANFFNGSISDVRIYNRILSSAEIQTLYYTSGGSLYATSTAPNTINQTPTGMTNTDLKNGLILNWSFDGKYTSWNSTLPTFGTTTDLSGNNRNGTIKNISRSSVVPGRIGQAIQIASTSGTQTVTLNVPLITSTTTALSWGGWFYVKNPGQTTIPSAVGIMGQETYLDNTTGFYLYQTSANRYQCLPGAAAGGVYTPNGSPILANRWYHVFCVSTGSLISIYINSILVGTSTGTQAITPYNQAFSLTGMPGTGFMNGYADDIRVYNRAISAAEVRAIYTLGK